MDSNFGEFITKEYGLLKQILSYLETRDLHNARQVCREWSNAVNSLIQKNPFTTVLYEGCKNTSLRIPKNLIPDLVIQQNIDHDILVHNNIVPDKCKSCIHYAYACPCVLCHQDSIFISFRTICGRRIPESAEQSATYMFWQRLSLLLLPSSPKMQVSTFFAESRSQIFKKPVTPEVVSRCIGEDPIKCLLIISTASRELAKRDWIDNFITMLIQRQGMTFAIGGGDTNRFRFKMGYKPVNKPSQSKPGLILVVFRGDNVTAHSQLLSCFDKKSIEDSISQMGKTVGPVPENGSRVAFIAQCVDRIYLEFVESSAFRRTFPEVPQFGFQAYGEFGFEPSSLSDSLNPPSKKKKTMVLKHARTTSFVILTFEKI